MTPSRSLIEDDWPVIRRLLPDDLEQSAREHGAMRRRRGQVNSAEQLLRLILMHVAGRLSLEQTVDASPGSRIGHAQRHGAAQTIVHFP